MSHLLGEIDSSKYSHATLTSTPSGVPFYLKNGFRVTKQKAKTLSGIFTDMEYRFETSAQQGAEAAPKSA